MLRDHAASMCALCGEEPESASQLFVACGISWRVCYRIFRWLAWDLVLSRDVLGLFEGWCMFLGRVNFGRGFLLISHSVVWSIWSARNDIVPSAQR